MEGSSVSAASSKQLELLHQRYEHDEVFCKVEEVVEYVKGKRPEKMTACSYEMCLFRCSEFNS